jgi:arylsulfatase A-like enzyme
MHRSSLLACLLSLTAGGTASAQQETPPRLILQITVDQLRADLPRRVYDRLGNIGFKHLMERGIRYDNAHHGHANTETVVGHATLATGADPSTHGMVANVWFDHQDGTLRYNVEDPRYSLLTPGGSVDAQTEIDPTQRQARTDGRSPAALLVSTFADELALFTAGESKIFGVSVKDRGAITMAGHAGKAFWFSKATGTFVTSDYYYDAYPAWVDAWNAERPVDAWADTSWELVNERATYTYGRQDDRECETALPGFGRTFPHPYGPADGKYYTTFLTLSPAGDELTLDFAKTLIENEELGQDAVPDYLSVSFSCTDYVGHVFGPSSLESEDNLLRLDRTLADLLAFVEEKVGLVRSLIILSADHGAVEAVPAMNELGIEARTMDFDALDRAPAIAALKDRFGIGEELIETWFHPYLHLNRDAIAERGLVAADVERAVAAELVKFEGIASAFTRTDLLTQRVPATAEAARVLRNHHPERSGDIYVVLEPNWFVNDFDGLTVATTHGSPWRYDTYVPLTFTGMGLPPRVVNRPVETVDVAATLSLLLGTKFPSGCVGVPLEEVLFRRTAPGGRPGARLRQGQR